MNFCSAIVGCLLASSSLYAESQAQVHIVRPEYHKEITPLYFGANGSFISPALYYGTLPERDPDNLRPAFRKALLQSGVKIIRFPGGTYSHTYLFDSPKLCEELGVRTRTWFYDSHNWDRNLFVRLENLLAFCKEAGVALIYQLPTCFVVAGGKAVPFVDSNYSKTGGFQPRWHLVEAAAYVRKIVRVAQDTAPNVVRVWEVGNEEWANMDPSHYAAVCRTCLDAIRQVDRRTPIVVTGQVFLTDIAPLLKETGHLKDVAGFTADHCFGNWYGHSAEKRTDIENFVRADYGITKWLDVTINELAKKCITDVPQSVTECAMHRMEDWDSFKLVATLAHGLAYVSNWGDVLRHPKNNMGVFHDLQSTYFGLMQFDVWWDEAERKFVQISPNRRADHKDIAAKVWFERRYVVSPTGCVNRMLSKMCDGTLLLLDLQKDSPCAALPGEYRTGRLKGNATRGSIDVTAPPFSILQIKARL